MASCMSKNLPMTRQALLDPEGALVQYRKGLAWSVLEKALFEALRKKHPVGTVGIRASELTLERYEPAPKWTPEPLQPPVINVLIVNSETAGQQAQEDRRSIRVVSSEGNGAGDPVSGRARRREDLGGVVGDGDARD